MSTYLVKLCRWYTLTYLIPQHALLCCAENAELEGRDGGGCKMNPDHLAIGASKACQTGDLYSFPTVRCRYLHGLSPAREQLSLEHIAPVCLACSQAAFCHTCLYTLRTTDSDPGKIKITYNLWYVVVLCRCCGSLCTPCRLSNHANRCSKSLSFKA